jgi:hypothetical protein
VDVDAGAEVYYRRPLPDGSFQMTADKATEPGLATMGLRLEPDSGRVTQLWRFDWTAGDDFGANDVTAFDQTSGIGIATDYELLTRVVDLRTGTTRLTIDNRGPEARERAASLSGLDEHSGDIGSAAPPIETSHPGARPPAITPARCLAAILIVLVISLAWKWRAIRA